MITAQGITYQVEEGKTTACEDFSFSSGINYLNYQRKDIYDVLSFSFSSLTEGSFAVDGVSIQPSGFVGGSAKVIKLDANHLGSITLISFYKQDDPQADCHFQKLATELKTLKSKTETAEDKKDKITLLMTVLSLNDVSYLLLDLNDSLTAENRSLWLDAFANYQGCVFILLKAFEGMANHFLEEENQKGKFLAFYPPLTRFVIDNSALHRSVEFDGISATKDHALFVECKDRNALLDREIVRRLMENASLPQFAPFSKKEFALVSKSGFTPEAKGLESETVHLYSLEEMMAE